MTKTAIKFESTYTTTKSTALKSSKADEVTLESFKINITEIEIEFDDDDPMFETDTFATDLELKGPFEVDLMKDGNTLATYIASNVELPPAAYDEIEFEFDKNKYSNSEMFGKTIEIKGTINNIPFIFWTDEEFEVEIEFDDPIYFYEDVKAAITVSFNLNTLFDLAHSGIDISAALDGNNDGLIEIYEGDNDGNSNLASLILDSIEYIIEAFEDQYYYYDNYILTKLVRD